MRKVVVSEFVSLDGVMEDPMWTFQFGTKEQEQFKFDELFASDTLLLGRITYEAFASSWPTMEGTGEFGEKMNSIPKVVATTTLDKAEWNATVIEGEVADEVARLKQLPGQDILVYGSADLVQTLIQHNLIDEYRIMIFPIVLGKGKRLFGGGIEKTLKFVESKTFPSGVTVLTYQPAQSDAT